MRELLVGILVDVSGSMTSAIENRSGTSSTRLEAFRDALEQLAEKAAHAVTAAEQQSAAADLRLFAYGFGFGNVLSDLFGRRGPAVRDLLELPGAKDSAISARQLNADWPRYKANVERLIPEMFGSTPMGEALDTALKRFGTYHLPEGQRILLIVSDGDPTDQSPEAIEAQAAKLKEESVVVVSCYVTRARTSLSHAGCMQTPPLAGPLALA